jgi:hypothetical protein
MTTRRGKKSTKNNAVVKNDPAKLSHDVGKSSIVLAEHLPPLALVFTVLICSGVVWVLGLRDLLATGKPFLGSIDEAYLVSGSLMFIKWVCNCSLSHVSFPLLIFPCSTLQNRHNGLTTVMDGSQLKVD